MKKTILTLIGSLVFILSANAQIDKYAFGLYSDVLLEAPVYDTYLGIQAKYTLNSHNALQAQFALSNAHITTIGADFLHYFFNTEERNFNIYAGAGLATDFYRRKITVYLGGEEFEGAAKKTFFALNPQFGIDYRIPSTKLSLYTGYKVKFYLKEAALDINYLTLGIRYHIK